MSLLLPYFRDMKNSLNGYNFPSLPISPVIKNSKHFKAHKPRSPFKELSHLLQRRSSDHRIRGNDDKSEKQTVV